MKYTSAQSSYFQQAVPLPTDALCLRDFMACANEVSADKADKAVHHMQSREKILLFFFSLFVCFLSVGCVGHSALNLKIEHIALDVAFPEKTAEWWCENLGFELAVKQTAPPFAIFIREHEGRFAMELYRAENTSQAPDYHQLNPLQLHIAFLSENLNEDIERLTTAGATLVSRQIVQGSKLAMLRDPSGIPFQLVQRQIPILK